MVKTKQKSVQSEKSSSINDHLVQTIIDQFNLVNGQPEQVQKSCHELQSHIKKPLTDSDLKLLEPLFPLMQEGAEDLSGRLFSFLKEMAARSNDPFPFVKAIIQTRHRKLALDALEYAVQLAKKNKLKIGCSFLSLIAERMKTEATPFTSAEAISNLKSLIEYYSPKNDQGDRLLELFFNEDDRDIRELAATILDSSGEMVTNEVAKTIFGAKHYKFLAPYLAYTRATYSDLLYLQTAPDALSSLLNDLIHAEKIVGRALLFAIIAKLGWKRINLGLGLKTLVSITVKGSPPFMVSEAEASLMEMCGGVRQSTLYVVNACGGQVTKVQNDENRDDPIARFRSYNLNHATLLGDFLDMGPLDVKKIRGILAKMDKIVEDFVTLFCSFSNECSILPGLYQELKSRITAEIDEHTDKPQLSANLTRLVQSFEDPRSLGDVRTLHGLKRYLHQQGLSLGFRLVEGNRLPNRTADVLIASKDGIHFVLDKIHFADFEPVALDEAYSMPIPLSVELILNGFTQQMLHGQEQFPHVDIFCYGNEVHYYFSFRNHPVFLRIDYAPPVKGGMIDLEYYGVSNYELDQHPDISLGAIRTFFEHMEYDVSTDGTHIHARYDKERALNLGDLIRKARYIFRIAPYFMDLDWTIGSLALEKEARLKVVAAWKDFFLHWGFLPLKSILSKNRRGILTGHADEPTGRREILWSGQGEYKDLYTGLPPAGFYESLKRIIKKSGLEISTAIDSPVTEHPGQLNLEQSLLNQFSKSLARGELICTPNGFQLQSGNLFERVHEAELFAELLASGSEAIESVVRIAHLVRPLERNIQFNTTGSINGFLVQSAILELCNHDILIYALRGGDNIIHLAFFSRDRVLYKKRTNESGLWISNACYDVSGLVGMLRVNAFTGILPEPVGIDDKTEAVQFLEKIVKSELPPERAPLRGEKVITGLIASPGRAVGKAVFGTEGRNPQDLKGAILIAASVTPQDTSFLYYADGIISTGGGILSHAGLIAMQFCKPALIISGDWITASGNKRVLHYQSLEYQVKQKKIADYNVCIRSDIHEQGYILQEGDLLIVDALAGKIQVMGQERDILALYEGFRLYTSAAKMLATAKKEVEILKLRGNRLRARHQLENVLRRCSNMITARYAMSGILFNGLATVSGIIQRDKEILLSILINHHLLKNEAQDYLKIILADLKSAYLDSMHKAEHDIPESDSAFEIISLRLDTINQYENFVSAGAVTRGYNKEISVNNHISEEKIESMTGENLSKIRENLIQHIVSSNISDNIQRPQLRHLLRQLNRIDQFLNTSSATRCTLNNIMKRLAKKDSMIRENLADRYVIKHGKCGFELYYQIGWKAANLAEIERLAGEKYIPPWFVVTDKTFKEVLNTPVNDSENAEKESSLGAAINNILNRDDLNNHQKSLQIRALWEHLSLPEKVCHEVIKSYREITNEIDPNDNRNMLPQPDFVALRSSSQEEDTEAAARAGEFETYLYVHGQDQLLYYLKRTWSGLWTERAIHNRIVFGTDGGHTGGGVIVQRMINSRVSGVLQTVNIPRNNLREIVINAGLGLGEGVVSGTVAADQVTVVKSADYDKEPLRFSYITSDKAGQIVFNQHAGFGTVYAKTLYHQRLRPALEYVELCQLVKVAASLEQAYGYPLDIEFGIEGSRLWLLQARPVVSCLAAFKTTLERFPLKTSGTIEK